MCFWSKKSEKVLPVLTLIVLTFALSPLSAAYVADF